MTDGDGTRADKPGRWRPLRTVLLGERGFTVPEKAGPSSPLAQRLELELAALDVDDDQVPPVVERPRTRGDCAGGERPCPWISCRHHIAIDVLDTGSLRITSDLDLEAMRSTCSLDIADAGEHTLEEVGMLLNLTRERVRQIESRGQRNAETALRRVHIRKDAIAFFTNRNRTQEL
jgi:hypothetical protein